MGIRVSGPEVVAFLEWLRTSFPDVRSAVEIGEPALHDLAERFIASHFHNDDDADHSIRGHDATQRGRWSLSPTLHWLNSPMQYVRYSRHTRELARDLVRAVEYPEYMSSNWNRRYGRGASRVDLLNRYRTIPFRSIFLYTSQDQLFGRYVRQHWSAWSDRIW